MQQVPKVRLIGVVVGLLALAALWYVRPIWHGLALVLWTAPIVWVPPLLLLAAGVVTLRRSRRSWTTLEELQAGGRVPAGIVAFPVLAFLSLVVLGGLNGPLVQRAIVTNTSYEDIPSLPASGKVRLVPRDVAETNASSGFNSSTETLTDFRIINTPQGLTWTALRTPNGAFRIFTKKSEGLVRLDAESTSRSVEQVDAEFETAPALQLTDNLRWRLLKERFLVRLEDPVAIPTPRGPRILVPYTEHKGFPIRRPVPGGVFVVAPDGTIEDLEPQEAARRPELAVTGRIIADTQARRFHDAYAYKGGLWNAWFVHEDQTQITDTELNRQPYLIDFGGQLGTQWVTVAEPYGRAFAASAIFLTDTDSGQTRIWRVPRGRSLSGNRRALDAVRSSAIPGIDFTNFRVVEPRPVFVNGRLLYVVSIIPARGNAVSKTVVVDAETNRFVARFDNDSDPQAEEKTLAFLETGRLPDGTRPGAGAGAAAGGTGATGTTGSTGTTGATGAGGARDVQQRIDDLIERQRQTLRELEELQRQVRTAP